MKRNVKIVNLDPAAEKFNYQCHIDIRDLITVTDVMEKFKYGPNGALIYCMEYLLKNFAWLEERMNDLGDNTYFMIDCPGQLELYSHYNVIKSITNLLSKTGINICSVFCLDSTFLQEQSKFISGCLLSLATMVQMSLPHLTVLTKCDLIEDKALIENIHELDPKSLSMDISPMMGKSMGKLNEALTELIDNYSLVDFFPLDYTDEETVNSILYHADSILQYFDNQEPKEEYYKNIEDANQDQEDENENQGDGYNFKESGFDKDNYEMK